MHYVLGCHKRTLLEHNGNRKLYTPVNSVVKDNTDATTAPQAHMMKLLSGEALDGTYSENYIEIRKKRDLYNNIAGSTEITARKHLAGTGRFQKSMIV